MRDIQIDNAIFMIGMPRSGTTIISEAISMHEDLGWVSQYMNLFPGASWIPIFHRIVDIPGIGRYLRGKKRQGKGTREFIKRLLPRSDEAFTLWAYYCGEKILRDYLINCAASGDEKNRIKKLIRTALTLQGKRRFFTKFTGPPRIWYLNSIFPDAYFVHVLRDPRAVVSSLLKVPFWRERCCLERPWWLNGLPEAYIQEWIDTGRSPAALAAVQWKRVVELTWEEKKIIAKGRYIEVRYEDFVTDSHGALREILSKAELSDSLTIHHYISSVGRVENMNYKYKKHLTKQDIALVENLTRDTAKQAGYHF